MMIDVMVFKKILDKNSARSDITLFESAKC